MICQCGHHADDHDAGECWAEVNGQLGVQCPCNWWELAIERRPPKTMLRIETPEDPS